MKRKKQGYITVFLSLMIAVILVLITTMIEGARIQTIRFYIEGVTDLALSSAFSEYHRELFHRYGLFYIDSSYGTSTDDDSIIKSHIMQFMNDNYKISRGRKSKVDFLDLHTDNVTINKKTYASDEKGKVLKYQIMKYMDQTSGMDLLEKIDSDGVVYDDAYQNREDERQGSESRIKKIMEEINMEREEGTEEISFENPADSVNALRNGSILSYALSDKENLSTKKVLLENYISHRNIKEGEGLYPYQKEKLTAIDKIKILAYVDKVCGDFQKCRENSALDYQKEYLIYGHGSDTANLDAFANELFRIRYVINAAYLFGCVEKKAQAEAMALTVTSGIGHPELAELVKITLLYAWTYVESIQDMRILFDGKKVASVKTDATWNRSLEEIFCFIPLLDSYRDSPSGEDYDSYLNKILFFKSDNIICFRLMDIMEMDIRKTSGNQNFKMDRCIYQAEITANVSSGYGYGYDITRRYSYE